MDAWLGVYGGVLSGLVYGLYKLHFGTVWGKIVWAHLVSLKLQKNICVGFALNYICNGVIDSTFYL